MDSNTWINHFRQAILANSPVHEKALTALQEVIIPENIKANDYFSKAGDYSLFFAYIGKGLFRSYYRDNKDKEHCTGFFSQNMFMLPLPSFLYRKPAFQFFQAIQDASIIKIKYADIEQLARKHPSLNDFLRTIIDREWIIKKELALASKYIYNHHTRFQLFLEQFRKQLAYIPVKYISSYLNIPEKQLGKFIEQEINKTGQVIN